MRSPVRRRLGVSLAVPAGLVLVSGCTTDTVDQWSRFGLPDSATASAPHTEALWVGAWIAATIVGVLVWGLIIWAAVRYRRRRPDEVPTQVRYNLPIEVLYTVAPFVIIFVLFYHTVVTQNEVLSTQEKNAEEILVVAQQWSWTFNYLGEDGRDPANAANGDDVFDVGTVADFPTLVLPVNKPVKFMLRSQDVVHSFWVPAFYFKMDIVPGRLNTWVTTPTKLGTYAGKCTEFCGLEHSRMLFNVKVVTQREYQQHLQNLRARGDTGVVLGSTEPDRVAGLETHSENGAGH
ncbi:MAG: cytochrome c oxidase subunit II [Actinomycetota bacterium]|nr:cytochrome c oxidase subunit II [Actinomycetota bacterium]